MGWSALDVLDLEGGAFAFGAVDRDPHFAHVQHAADGIKEEPHMGEVRVPLEDGLGKVALPKETSRIDHRCVTVDIIKDVDPSQHNLSTTSRKFLDYRIS